MTNAPKKTPTPITPTTTANQFPGWVLFSMGGGGMALLREFPGGARALLTEPGTSAQEPTDPAAALCLAVYTSGQLELEGSALFECRDLAQVEDILAALTLIGETAIANDDDDADPNDCAECGRQHGPHFTGRCDHGVQS